MDLNKNVQLSYASECASKDHFGDTALCLNFFGHRNSKAARFGSAQSDLQAELSNAVDDGCGLVLGLGPTPSVCCDNYYNVKIKKNKGPTVAFTEGLSTGDESILKLGLSGVTKESLSIQKCSMSTETGIRMLIPVVDEGSTSAKKSGGYMPTLLFAPRADCSKASELTGELLQFATKSQSQQSWAVHESSSHTDFSISTSSLPMTTLSKQHIGNSKKCKFAGCTKGARGSSGLCIGHGGGQRCQKLGCNKGAESRTAYCKAHGGGKRCQHLGCTKSAEGKTDLCIAHGGGRRCSFIEGCNKAARGKSGLCIKHGGGKRCKMEGCTRSAEGQAGLCISHGGGKRCQFHGCNKGAQGSTMFCKAHGGGKRCIFARCTKGAEGSTPLCKAHGGGKRCLYNGGGICPKSVHGGTNFCVAHGGGKRCVVPGCTKSARGRTDCCVKHGGGKRCKFENCGKSAQGSTDFCKAHGGGKRCSWAENKCEKFARGKSGLCAAHSSMAHVREASKEGLIAPGVFHGLVPSVSTTVSSFSNNHSISGAGIISDCIDSMERPAKRQQLIPPQVLVPQSMKSSPSYSCFVSAEKIDGARNGYGTGIGNSGASQNLEFLIPEGRVHGGALMSLFGGSLKHQINGI